MALAYWNRPPEMPGTAPAEVLYANQLVAKAALVVGQATQTELVADGDPRAQGAGHALDEGPWDTSERWSTTVRNGTQKTHVSSI